jgi:hypothetical protein
MDELRAAAEKALDSIMDFRHEREGMVRGGRYINKDDALAAVRAALSDAAASGGRPAPTEPVTMPPYWSVEVHADGDKLVSIGDNWLSGERALEEADERAILGAAQHLLAFIGYGLPSCQFNPDESEPSSEEKSTMEPNEQTAPQLVVFSCANAAEGTGRCCRWCGDSEKCVAALKNDPTPAPPQASSPSERQEAQPAWQGEEWERLAWELCAREHGEDACNDLLWEGGPIPQPWGDRWLKYEGEAKQMIALVRQFAPARAERQEAAAAGQGERLLRVTELALSRFMMASYARAEAAAQDKAGVHFKAGDAEAFLRDARDAEEALARASLPASPSQGKTAAARDVLAERQRQISVEGWTPEHDDEHREGELALAAAGYAVAASDHIQAVAHEFDAHGEPTMADAVTRPSHAPWPHGWEFKAAPARRLLVKAGALILGEIERLDRAAPSQPAQGDA